MNIEFILQQLINGISLGGVVTICAYLGFFISTQIMGNLWISLLMTTIAGGIISVLVEKLVFRPIRIKNKPLTYLFVNSITVTMIVQQFFAAVWGNNYYPYPDFIKKATLTLGKLVVSKSYLLMLAIAGILAGITGYFLGMTYTGRSFYRKLNS